MRPINRGTHPEKNGNQVVFGKYQDAKPFLLERLGDYCSYCEEPCPQNLHVEHVQPKSLYPALELAWDNFLLGCPQCNTIKGDTDVHLNHVVLPSRDNTFRAFIYERDRVPHPHPALTPVQQQLAQATLRLTGLDREPGLPGNSPSSNDKRWLRRQRVWGKALTAREHIKAQPNDQVRRMMAVDIAVGWGYWSVWITVFHDDSDMLQRLLDAFPGTAGVGHCFDAVCQPIPRNQGLV